MSFGQNGYFAIPHVSGSGTNLQDLKIDSQDRIVATGRKKVSTNDYQILTVRLNLTGVVDTSFQTNGVYLENFHHDAWGAKVFIQDNDDILIGGYGSVSPFGLDGVILMALKANNGSLDPTFGTNGRVHQPVSGISRTKSIQKTPNGNYFVTGDGNNVRFTVSFQSDGSVNTSFANNGIRLSTTYENNSGYVTDTELYGNRLVVVSNAMFAHCAQSKYKGLLERIFINDNGLQATAYPAPDMEVCDTANNGTGNFDLTQNASFVLGGQDPVNFPFTFYTTLIYATNGTNSVSNPSTFSNTSNPQEIFVRVEDNQGNFDITSFQLRVMDTPDASAVISDYVMCDGTPADGLATFDLTTKIPEILMGQNSAFEVSFHETAQEASDGLYAIANPNSYANFSNPQILYIRITNLQTGCSTGGTQTLNLRVVSAVIDQDPVDLFINEGDGDGLASFDLTQNNNLILGNQNPADYSISYYESANDATNEVNAITNPTAYANLSNPQTIYVRLTHLVGECFSTDDFEISTDETVDSDGDGVTDVQEDLNQNGNLDDDDTDGDGIPNYLDQDDDDDGVLTAIEITGIGAGLQSNSYAFIDTDNDGIENYLDNDDDDDGILTVDEDYNGNGSVLDDDVNGNQVPDFLDASVTLSTQTLEKELTVSIYPNPTNEQLTIELEQPFISYHISIYDLQGNRLMIKEVNEKRKTSLDVSSFASGSYFIVLSNKGHRSAKLFIKK